MAASKGLAVFVNNGEEFNVNDPNTADEFSTSKAYEKGDHVYYQGSLYRFKYGVSAGAWNSAYVELVKIGESLKANRISGNYSVYFSNGETPEFSDIVVNKTSSTITVKFPNAEFRIYTASGKTLLNTNTYSGQSFVVGNMKRLVCNLDGAVSVVDYNQNYDAITLLTNSGGSFGGPLADYLASINESAYKNEDDLIVYFSNGSRPSFVTGGSGTGAVITVMFPSADFRIYQRNGKLVNEVPSASITVKTFTVGNLYKLVFDRKENTFSVIQTNSTAAGSVDKVTLLANCAGVGIGLLADYLETDMASQNSDDMYNILNAAWNSSARFMFFSDVHGGTANVSNIVAKANAFSDYVDAIINGGDTSDSVISSGGLDWYNAFYNVSTKDILTCAGNHDVWANQETWAMADKATVYGEIIAPMIAKVSNIIQPSDAATSKSLYYYKDYGDVRVIVLDAMVSGSTSVGWWDASELAWFENVLADAKTYSKHVVCVAHPPYEKSIAVRDNDSPLNSYLDYRTGTGFDNICIPEAALDAVDAFITAGGSFVGWLTGHTHVDNVLTATGHPGQFMISIATARVGRRIDSTRIYRSFGDFWVDLFDYVTVNTADKTISVYRIGNNKDQYMRVRTSFCYKWDTCEFIAQ
jgi:hypothetical protein